tara:strand:+ start:617 stop:886 length:270 start_codon:yes stop_codon:yes gene_type:complete
MSLTSYRAAPSRANLFGRSKRAVRGAQAKNGGDREKFGRSSLWRFWWLAGEGKGGRRSKWYLVGLLLADLGIGFCAVEAGPQISKTFRM